MTSFPNMREMARLATENYSRIDSLEQIRAPYPANGTPNWWALRLRYEELLLARIRKDRKGVKLPNEDECESAKWAAIGNEEADRRYQSYVPTAEQVAKRTRPNWIAMQADIAKRLG